MQFLWLFYGASFRCLRNVDADEYNIEELNKLPDEVDDQVLWIDPLHQQRLQQRMVLTANDKNVPDEPEDRDPDLYRKQYNQLMAAEFWTHCPALQKITLKLGAQVRHLTFQLNSHGLSSLLLYFSRFLYGTRTCKTAGVDM